MPHRKVPAAAVLFDIDGTLTHGSSSHLDVLRDTLTRTTGLPVDMTVAGETPTLNGHSIAGWVDGQAIRAVLANAGNSNVSDADIAAITAEYEHAYKQAVNNETVALPTVVPGADDMLPALQDSGIPFTLMTGNAMGVAETKLNAVGLGQFFTFVRGAGFGDTARSRTELVSHTVRPLGVPVGPLVVVVGDTPADMEAARVHGCTPFGVLTGSGTRASLTDADAAVILTDVNELPHRVRDVRWVIGGPYARWFDVGLHPGDAGREDNAGLDN